ncbi:MAG TPA: MarR family transcriptional regulator, partial [Tistrella mobilis]|nr:MarR family transcriptional regulator [Tistrella mobilis]
VLGPGCTLTREDHILAGGRRCSYRVRVATGTNR